MGEMRLNEGNLSFYTRRTDFTGRLSMLALLARACSCKWHRPAAISAQQAGQSVDVG
jgi:hypothetical protein